MMTGPWPARPTPAIMGILNATPDSFSGSGGPATLDQAQAMIEAGADILDIGGESTRPGATPVAPEEERRRVLPLIRALAGCGVPLSVDTRNASTMRAALDAGAAMINDVSALAHDPAAAALLADCGCRVVLMHMRGTPQTMQGLTEYGDVVEDVARELSARVAVALAAGIRRDAIILDPGFGFAKTAEQSVALLRGLDRLTRLGFPVLAGLSRKGFVGAMARAANPASRMPGSIAAALFALERGATILRVHDVAETVQAVRVWQTLRDRAPFVRAG